MCAVESLVFGPAIPELLPELETPTAVLESVLGYLGLKSWFHAGPVQTLHVVSSFFADLGTEEVFNQVLKSSRSAEIRGHIRGAKPVLVINERVPAGFDSEQIQTLVKASVVAENVLAFQQGPIKVFWVPAKLVTVIGHDRHHIGIEFRVGEITLWSLDRDRTFLIVVSFEIDCVCNHIIFKFKAQKKHPVPDKYGVLGAFGF
jgi:hypothetical protein